MNERHLKKLSYQLQQMAFQKYPFQINNKTFFCLQTYFQDQLLNGVQLQLKQAKGMTSEQQKIAYIAQTQQIIMPIGSNIISYNAQKRGYSLLTEVNGYVEILRTYTSKINNKTYIFWLESDEEGLNMRVTGSSRQKNGQKGTMSNMGKMPSIWNLSSPLGALLNKKEISLDDREEIKVEDKTDIREEDKVDDRKQGKKGTINKLMQALGRMSKPQSSPKKQAVITSDKPIQQPSKSRKKVRIEAPQASQQQPPPQTPKKRMRICLFDHQKKCLLHKQPLQIEQHQTISQIILYFITQKMVGYVINDENEERGRIYYKKIKIDEGQWQQGKEQKGKRKGVGVNRRVEKWGVLEAIFEIPLLKYNGETDQYLFKDLNTVYSVQVYQVEHEMAVRNGSSSKSLLPSKKPASSKSLIPSKNLKLTSKNSILFSSQSQSQPLDQQNLSKQIQKVTNKLITPNKNQPSIKDKYAIRICQQIQLFTDQTIIDISINQVYLVVLTNQWIRFYSIFNLNTLLFKCEMHDVKECPPPTTVELNKSYLLLTHENSTLVSSYTILQRKLKYNSTCQVEIEHCQSILKLFMNSYNCQVAILAKQFQIEGRVTNLLKSKRIIQNAFHSYKKTFLDLSLAYINFSSTKCQTKSLFMKNQRFRNVLTCKWNSQYLLQTDNQILAKDWREAFQNLKCSCLHPTGQYLIIGFNDCFKIYAVTQQGLQNTYMSDGVKDCQAIAYSEYGQHFAVGSSNSIGIYSSYDCTKRQTITLPMGSLVQSLQYRNSHLICTLRTRRIIVYHSLLQYKEIFTFNPKNYLNENKHQFSKKGESQQNLLALTIKGLVGLQVNSLYYDLELGVVIFSSGRKVVFYNVVTNESLGNYQIQAISCMEYNKQLATLFLGTFSGQLIAFPWPNKPSNIMSQVPRFKFHSQKITKIRLTSDYKYLITLGNDMSIYKCQVSYILNLKRLKGTEIAEYKGNKNVLTYCNFLLNKGVCQFSHSQTTEKLEIKKQLEEEVVNTVFMLPEERMKQKEQLFDQLKVTQERLDDENSKEYEPLQEETAGLRNRIYKTKDDLHKMKKFTQKQLQRHKQQYQQKTSKLLKTYSQLNTQYRKLKLTLDDQLSTKKLQYQTQYQQLLKQNQQKQQQLLTQISQKQQQNQTIQQRFLELQLIEQEKQTYLTRQLEMYQAEFQQITTKNGQLACKNSAIEKELLVIKYRIQQLKLVVLNANKSIDKLKTKNLRENQEKQVFENLLVENAKIDVSEMEKKYIKVTKQLIEKNKVIDINLNQYEKEKEILVQLEKTVEKTQEEIDRIVDSLQQEKDFMKFLTMKCQAATQRYKEVANLRTQKKTIKNKTKLQLNKFFQQLQKLEKQLQSAFNQNKKQFSSQTTQVINKIKLFSSTSPKPQVESDKNQKSLETGNRKTHRKDKEDEQCDNVVERENPLYELLGTFKKTGSAFNKDKRGKNARCVTEEKSARSVKETNTLVDHRNKTTFKLNYKKLTDRQKTISPQSSLLNNTISTSKLQQQSSLLKTTSKYYQVKTQASYQTDRPTSNPFNPSLAQKSPFSSYQRQKLIQKQKQNVFKKLTSEDKLVNKIRNDKKLFMTSKKRLHLQNQDLINTYNSLTYDNKYFKNILKAYEQTLDQDDKNYIFSNPQQFSKNFVAFAAQSTNTGNSKSYKNLPAQSGKFGNFSEQSQEQKLVTPFDKYLKNKEDKISQLQNKTLGNEDFTITQRDHFKPTLNKITKSKASQQKRVKTLPCVQYAL